MFNKKSVVILICIIISCFYFLGGFCPLAIRWARSESKVGMTYHQVSNKAVNICTLLCLRDPSTARLKNDRRLTLECENKIVGTLYRFDIFFNPDNSVESVSEIRMKW